MNFFTFDLRKVILIVVLLAIPLLSVNVKHDPQNPTWYLRPFTFVITLAQSGIYSFCEGVRDTTTLYINLVNIKTNNRLLRKENDELRAQLTLLEELKNENNRLSSLLNFTQQSSMSLQGAKIIGQDLVADHSTIVINRGTKHGVAPGMAVISTEGVVGYILRPEYTTSQVLLLTDRYAVIDAVVQRTRARGIIEGKSKDNCQLRYLERADDVAVGDLVVTSNFDEKFPKGFPIGFVENVTQAGYGASLKVTVKPIVKRHKLEEVFIVIKPGNEPTETVTVGGK